MAASRKSFPFYPCDWMKDPNLRRCSPAARGIWMDLLCLMFEGEEPGTLISANRAWPKEDIAAALGGEPVIVLRCLEELVEKGVLHTDARGAYCSSRMKRRAELQLKRRLAAEQRRQKLSGSQTPQPDEAEGVAIVEQAPVVRTAANGSVRGASERRPQTAALPVSREEEDGQRWQIRRQLGVLNRPTESVWHEPTLDSPASDVFL